MRRASLVVCLLFAAAGIFMIVGGYLLKLKGLYGPGPGFTAFWVGVPLLLLSLVWFAQLCFGAKPSPQPLVEQGGLRRVAAIVAALIVFAAVLLPLGFKLTMLALLLFLFFAFDRQRPVLKLGIALIGSFGVHFAFTRFLRVPLPNASIEFLGSLGL